MGIGSIGSTQSFWQQDQDFWNQQQNSSNSAAATTSIINAIGSAETNLGKGLASIANQTALDRVNSQLSAAIQSLLTGGTGSTSTAASSSSSSGGSTSAGTPAKPAQGTGTAPLTVGTSLSTLGIPAGGSIVISAGGNTTTYASTGSDTVGDLMSAINQNLVGNAAVTASLNKHGDLVLTSKNTTDMISVGGVYAGNLGFGVTNDTFKPTKGTTGTGSATTSSPTTSSASSRASSSSQSGKKSYTTLASVTSSSAASLLSDSGVSGSLVDMLA